MAYLLLISVFVIATCGLVYELVAGALASYLLGDSITQFSTIIGTYLFAMGVGSWLSKYIRHQLVAVFVRIELLIGLIGGFSGASLFLLFEFVSSFQVLLYTQVFITGLLVGLEIPLLMRLLQDRFDFKDLVSNIFTFDYIGALLASLLFPLVLVPQLGLVRTALLFGIFNVAVAIWAISVFREELRQVALLRIPAALSLVALVLGMIFADQIVSFAESQSYDGSIVYAKSSPYQRIVISRDKDHFQLYLNGNLQFDSRDEYRYHEALVHPGLAALPDARRILIMGGGDGLALREIFRYPGIESVDLVDLDPEVTRIFSSRPDLCELNDSSLHDPRLQITNTDAFSWLRENQQQYDFIVVDFPDPGNFSVGKLYSLRFYRELRRALRPGGMAVIQSTSPLVAPQSFWCIDQTLQAAGFRTVPYHTYVPSFGEWGFNLVMEGAYVSPALYPPGLRFLSAPTLQQMLHFPADMRAKGPVEVNRLNNQALVGYFEKEWARYAQ